MSTEFYNRNWRMANSWTGTEDNNTKFSNYSMTFDGSSEYVETSSNVGISGSQSRSMSVWLKGGSGNNSKLWPMAVAIGAGSTDKAMWIGGGGSTGEYWYFGWWGSQSATSGDIDSGVRIDADNDWHMLTSTYDESTQIAKGYIDGVEVASFSRTGINTTDSVLKIGKHLVDSTYWDGQIDGVSIFDYELSQAQVTQLYGSSSTGVGNPMAITNGRKPVAYYPLGDYSAYNGTEYLVPNSAVSDYVFDFDGTNDYISAGNPNELQITGQLTISLWFKTSTTPSSNKYLISKGTGSYTQRNFGIWQSSTNTIRAFINGVSAGVTSPLSYANGNWHHIAVTYTPSTSLILYIDGSVVDTNTSSIPAAINNNTSDFEIGRWVSDYWTGNMNNVSIFNTALPATGTESIESLYNYGTPPDISSYSGLQGFWKLDASATFDGSSWSIPDDSSNSNTGTSSGMGAANLVQSNLNILNPYSRYALNFDGSNDYIEVLSGTSFDFGTSDFTISSWVNTTGTTSQHRTIACKQNPSNAGNWSLQILTNGKPSFYANNGSINLDSADNSVVNDGNWHNIILKRTSDVFELIVDNVIKDTQTVASQNLTNTENLRIGHRVPAYNAFFNGSLSNISIWNAGLNSAQVKEIFNNGLPSNLNNHSAYSNLVSWWQLGENSSFNSNWTVIDEKGTSNGVSVNMAEDDLISGVGTSGNGVSSGMGGADNILGEASYSNSNALSYGMGADAKSTSVPS